MTATVPTEERLQGLQEKHEGHREAGKDGLKVNGAPIGDLENVAQAARPEQANSRRYRTAGRPAWGQANSLRYRSARATKTVSAVGLKLLVALVLLASLASFGVLGNTPVRADDWAIGNIVGLCRGTEIREGPGFGYRVHTIVPEDNWAVKIIDGPRYADGEEWWDTSRRAAGDPSGGTGWVYRRQAESCRSPTPTPPPPPAPAQVVLIVGLSITPPLPVAGQWVNARFTVRNIGGQTFTPRYFGVKGRGPGDANYDFLWMENFTLAPGQEFTYDANRPLGPPGQYCFTPQYSPDGQTWTDIRWPNGNANQVCVVVGTATPTVTPTGTPTPLPAPPADLRLIQGLALSPALPLPGQWVNARFTVRNFGGPTFTARDFGVKGRGPGDVNYDFLWMENFTLAPGQEFTYDANRPLGPPGQYCFTPQYSPDGQTWTDIRWPNGNANQVCVVVGTPTPTATPAETPTTTPPRIPTATPTSTPRPAQPARLVLTGDLTVSPSQIRPGQSVNARFTVRNEGGQTFTARYFGVKGRGPGGLNADFQWLENFRLGPGETFTYDVNRSLDREGRYEFVPQYSPDGQTWVDLTRADGRTSRAAVEVSAPAPPPPPPPPLPPGTDPCSEAALRDYLTRRGSPLAGSAAAFVSAGQRYDVDPRFVVAIANAESSLGTNGRCATERHNAWGYGGGWPHCWLFSSWEEGIWQVTMDIGEYYFRRYNQRTIPSFVVRPHGTCTSHCWCVGGCEHWVAHVSDAYREMGGDPNAPDLSFTAACRRAPPSPPPPSSFCAQTQTNCYPQGECTWYAWERRKDLPCFLGSAGHARNWADSAQRCGFEVNTRPAPGAIAVFPPGVQDANPTYGHVAVVEEVNPDGSYRVSEYNYACPGCYGSRPVPADGRVRFIHRRLGAAVAPGEPARVLAQWTGAVAGGQRQTSSWTVPPGQAEVGFFLNWPGSALDLVVTDPHGRKVDENYPGAWIEVAPRTVYLAISDPTPGEWAVAVVGREVPEGTTKYVLTAVGRAEGRPTASPPIGRTGWLLAGAGALVGFLLLTGTAGAVWVLRRRRTPSGAGRPPRPSPRRESPPPRRGGSPPAPPRSPPDAASAGRLYLQVLHGQAAPLTIPLPNRPLLIGRDPHCDVVLADPTVSARHAQIAPAPSGYRLADLGSTNGTFVNGRRVQQAILRPGDRIRIGATELQLGGPGPQRSPESPRPAVHPPAGAAWLEIGGRRYTVPASGGEVGRDSRCAVVLEDPTVSARHARLEYRDGVWLVTDLGSTNGTFVNGRRVQQQTLRRGDAIQFGRAGGRFWA